MRTRRATCLVAFAMFGWGFVKMLLDMLPRGNANYYGAPEAFIFNFPMMVIFGAISLTALYGAWRSHEALKGHSAPARGKAALLEAFVWMIFGFALLGLAFAGVVYAVGTRSDHGFVGLGLVYLFTTGLGLSGLVAFAAAYQAGRRARLTPYHSDLE